MKTRELAFLVVALTAAWQPSGARPQASLADLLNNAAGGSGFGHLGSPAGGPGAGHLINPAGGSNAGHLGNPAGGFGAGRLSSPAGGPGNGFPAEPSGFPPAATGFSPGVGGVGAGGGLPLPTSPATVGGLPLPTSPATTPTRTGGRSVSSIFVDDNAQLTLLGPVNPAGPGSFPTSSGSPTANTGGGSSSLSIVVDDDARLIIPASALPGVAGTFPTQEITAPGSSQGNPGISGTATGSSLGQGFGTFDPSSSATFNNNAFANGGQGGVQDFGNENFGRAFSDVAQSSAADGLLGALLSKLLGGIGGQAGGPGQDLFNSFAQITSSSLDNIARDANLGLRFIGDEIQFQGEEKLRDTFQGIQEAGRVVGQVGQNTYRGALRKKDVLHNFARDTVGNVGTFADSAVGASVNKLSESAKAFLHLFRDLKGAFLNALIAKGQAKKHLVDAQTETKSTAVDGILSEKSDVLRGKIRAVTGFSRTQQ